MSNRRDHQENNDQNRRRGSSEPLSFRRPPHRLVIALLGVVAGFIPVALYTLSHTAANNPPGPSVISACSAPGGKATSNSQCSWIIEIENEQSSLSKGYIVYPHSIEVNADDTAVLRASVYGPVAFQKVPTKGGISRIEKVSRIDVGGDIKAKLTSDMPGTVSLQSSEDQPVVGPNGAATWKWQLQPAQAGTFNLDLSFNVLRGGTKDLLTPDQTFSVTLTAHQSFGHVARSAGRAVLNFAESIGTISVALGCTAAGLVTWALKRRKRITEKKPTKE